MGCGCKDDKINEVVIKEPISVKSILKTIKSLIGMSLLLLVLTPFIVILIWYYGIGSSLGRKTNALDALLDYVKKKKESNIEDKIEEVDTEYELMDVDEIK